MALNPAPTLATAISDTAPSVARPWPAGTRLLASKRSPLSHLQQQIQLQCLLVLCTAFSASFAPAGTSHRRPSIQLRPFSRSNASYPHPSSTILRFLTHTSTLFPITAHATADNNIMAAFSLFIFVIPFALSFCLLVSFFRLHFFNGFILVPPPPCHAPARHLLFQWYPRGPSSFPHPDLSVLFVSALRLLASNRYSPANTPATFLHYF
jgi:hypothetical protein